MREREREREREGGTNILYISATVLIYESRQNSSCCCELDSHPGRAQSSDLGHFSGLVCSTCSADLPQFRERSRSAFLRWGHLIRDVHSNAHGRGTIPEGSNRKAPRQTGCAVMHSWAAAVNIPAPNPLWAAALPLSLASRRGPDKGFSSNVTCHKYHTFCHVFVWYTCFATNTIHVA